MDDMQNAIRDILDKNIYEISNVIMLEFVREVLEVVDHFCEKSITKTERKQIINNIEEGLNVNRERAEEAKNELV